MSKRKQVFAGFKAFIARSGKFSDASTSTYQKPLTKLHLLPLNSIRCEKRKEKRKKLNTNLSPGERNRKKFAIAFLLHLFLAHSLSLCV